MRRGDRAVRQALNIIIGEALAYFVGLRHARPSLRVWGDVRYQSDTVRDMAMTLRLTDEEQEALRDRATQEGISMQDAARRAVREYVERGEHRKRVAAAAERIKSAHAEALERLGQ